VVGVTRHSESEGAQPSTGDGRPSVTGRDASLAPTPDLGAWPSWAKFFGAIGAGFLMLIGVALLFIAVVAVMVRVVEAV
jgi:hypothetical protein